MIDVLIFNWQDVFEKYSVQNKFRRFLVKKNIRIWYIMIYHWLLFLGKKLHLISEEKYYQKYWYFLKNISITEYQLEQFKKTLDLKNLQYLTDNRSQVIVTQIPNFIVELIVGSHVTILGLPVEIDGSWSHEYTSIDRRIDTVLQDEGNVDVYGDSRFIKYIKKQNTAQTVETHLMIKGHRFEQRWRFLIAEIMQTIITIVLGLGISACSVVIAGYAYSQPMALDILKSRELFGLNSLPIVCIGLILFFVFGRIWVSFGLNFLIFIGLAFGNHYKLMFRDDPVTFSDLKLISEATNMSKKYTITLNWKHVVLIIAFIVCLVILQRLFKAIPIDLYRLLGMLVTIGFLFTFGKQKMMDPALYGQVGHVKYGNVWKTTSQYMSKGFPYAFSHSISQDGVPKPKGYSESKAVELLGKYKEQNIPDSKKVNVIMIMMEAFNDFSKYPQLQIDPSVYAGLKTVQSQSISGHLVTNIFAGGTIDTERKTLTGYSKLQSFNHNTDSFAWYLKKQGYQTQALHPMYGWFYNRKNVDPVLGISDFKYMENYYNKYNQFIVPDSDFFDSIHSFSEKSKQPYFNLSVTYQNHGPYNTKYSGQPLLKWQEGYNQNDYAIVNNYLTGIKKTSDAILELTKEFKNDKPTVIMLYGDHNPWLGENNSAYKMMNIDLNLSTSKGYQNYYQTPYVMWANNQAKKVLKKQFVGKGPDISPMYLMPEYFKQAGLKGDSYMQYLQKLETQINVFGENSFYTDNKFVTKLDGKNEKIYNNYKMVEYYRMHRKVN